jgi:hypothetical protein
VQNRLPKARRDLKHRSKSRRGSASTQLGRSIEISGCVPNQISGGIGSVSAIGERVQHGLLPAREKANIGGKGIGRFLWLKAFDHADMESIFQNSDGKRFRCASPLLAWRITHQQRSVAFALNNVQRVITAAVPNNIEFPSRRRWPANANLFFFGEIDLHGRAYPEAIYPENFADDLLECIHASPSYRE